MKVLKFSSIEAWKLWRLTRITGSRVKEVISEKGRKVASYALVAESWIGSAALAEEEESPELAMARGTRLEPEAIARFVQETGKKAVWHNNDIGWEHEDDSRIAISPDASIGVLEAVEAKCLSAKKHIEAFITKRVHVEHRYQMLQYFVVNKKLRKVSAIYYHPLFPKGLDFFIIELNRKDLKKEIEASYKFQVKELQWVRDTVNDLSGYVQAGPAPIAGTPAEIIDAELVAQDAQVLDAEAGLDSVYKGIKDRARG